MTMTKRNCNIYFDGGHESMQGRIALQSLSLITFWTGWMISRLAGWVGRQFPSFQRVWSSWIMVHSHQFGSPR